MRYSVVSYINCLLFYFFNFIYALRTLKMFLFGLFWLFQFTRCSNWLFRSVVSLYVQFYRRSTTIHSPQKYTISRPLLWGFQCRLKTRIPNNSQSQSGRFSCFFFEQGLQRCYRGWFSKQPISAVERMMGRLPFTHCNWRLSLSDLFFPFVLLIAADRETRKTPTPRTQININKYI